MSRPIGYAMNGIFQAGCRARSNQIRLTLLALAIMFIIANSIVALVSVIQLRKAQERMDRALGSIIVLKEVEDLVEDSSRDQRSYRLFGGQRELQAYRDAQAQLPSRLQRLGSLIEQDADARARFDHLSSSIAQDSAMLARSLAPVELQSGAAAIQQQLMPSVERSDRVAAEIGAIITSERDLLDGRAKVIASSNVVVLATVVVAAVGSIVLIGGIFRLMHLDLRRTELLAEQRTGELAESEQRFRCIFRESPLGIVLATAEGQHIVQANPEFCRLLGCDPEDLTGNGLANFAHVDDRDQFRNAFRRTVASTNSEDTEVRLIAGSGAILWARVQMVRLGTAGSQQGLLLALILDLTRAKRVEAELRQAQKMEAIGQLTGGIAHDFNNILGVIIGNAEFLIDTARDQEQSDLANEILNSALSGADLTRRLLALARRQQLQPQQIDLNAYLTNHIAILRRLLGESIIIITALASDLYPVKTDPSQVGDALLNLAINARDAMPYGGTISVATANVQVAPGDRDAELEPGDYVMLAVTDNGTGMPPEVLERAVEPFFSTKAPRAGSGLGLSMIFGFAKQSGGTLRIDSELGLGTTVRLYLPRARGVDQSKADQAEDLPKGNESILVVDDNAEIRSVAGRHLMSLGYRVTEAGSGPAALETLLTGPSIDLLLTDVVIPDGMTGYQLAVAARQVRPGLKVLFTTGYFRPHLADEVEAREVGPMIRKPFRRGELAATVRATLDR